MDRHLPGSLVRRHHGRSREMVGPRYSSPPPQVQPPLCVWWPYLARSAVALLGPHRWRCSRPPHSAPLRHVDEMLTLRPGRHLGCAATPQLGEFLGSPPRRTDRLPGSSQDPFSQRFIVPFQKELDKNGIYEDELHLMWNIKIKEDKNG